MRADHQSTRGPAVRGRDAMAASTVEASQGAGRNDKGFSLSAFIAIAALPATDIDRARRFYTERLGLTPTPGVAPGRFICTSGDSTFAVYETRGKASGTHEQMGFMVSDLDSVVRHLKIRGVVFTGDIVEAERTRSAWFKDSEGNLLMLREILACPSPNSELSLR